MQLLLKEVPSRGQVRFVQGINNHVLQAAYSLARAFIFPSLAEGFGWPIIEAQACGCPVITTDAAPMNEIGGVAATYIPLLKMTDDPQQWAQHASATLKNLLELSATHRLAMVNEGIANVARFNADDAIESYLNIYRQVLATSKVEADFSPSKSLNRKLTRKKHT